MSSISDPDETGKDVSGARQSAEVAAPEAHPCGHGEVTPDCGGCDPAAIEFIIDDSGARRPFEPIGVERPTPPSSHPTPAERPTGGDS